MLAAADRHGRPLLRVTFDFPDNDIAMSHYLSDQMEKIAKARWQKAATVAARYLAAGYIRQDEYDGIVDDLSKLSFERIEAFAERMFKKTSSRTAQQGEVLTAAVVQEPTALEQPQDESKTSLEDQLKAAFTVGSHGLTNAIK